jgi:uncharacterized protein YceH (UPF0502 family)
MSPEQLRVLGCLIEKQRTTPDAYPLSLNSLRLACNQSTNRDPVVDYDEAAIRDALHRLERKGLVRLASGAGSRASKYRHLLAEALPMQDGEQAVMCVLMLRGAQTPGELKQRTERMHRFEGLDDVGATLERLIERGLVARLDRRPGQKEERYEHLLGQEGEEEEGVRQGASASVPDGGGGVGSTGVGDGGAVAGSRGSAPEHGGAPMSSGAVPEHGGASTSNGAGSAYGTVQASLGERAVAAGATDPGQAELESRLSRLEERVGRIEELAGRVGRLEALMSELTGPEAQR